MTHEHEIENKMFYGRQNFLNLNFKFDFKNF